MKKDKMIKILPWAMVLLLMAIRLIHLKYYGALYLDSDCAANMQQAALKNEFSLFFPTSRWFYSTYVTTWQDWVFQLGLFLSPTDWRNARVISLLVFMVIAVSAYIFFAKYAGLSGNGAWTALIMVACFGERYSYTVTTGMMYYECAVYPFLILGLVFFLAGCNDKKEWVGLFSLILVSFTAGLNSIRMLVYVLFPLMVAVVLQLFINLKREMSLPSSTVQWKQRWDVRILGAAAIAFASNLAGYICNEKILPNHLSFHQYGDTKLADFDIIELIGSPKYIVQMLGYKSGAKILSLEGIRSMAAIALLAIFLVGILRGFQIQKKMTAKQQSCLLCCSSAAVISLVMMVLSSQAWDVHMVPTIYFFFPVLHIVWDAEDWGNKLVKGIVCACFVGCIVLLDSWQIEQLVQGSAPKQPYEKIADFLVENNLTQGYAGFWEAGIVTELSDGKVDVWTITDPWDWRPKQWLQDARHLEKAPEGRCFLLLNDDYEVGYYWDAEFADPNAIAYQEDGFSIMVFDDCTLIKDYQPIPFWER